MEKLIKTVVDLLNRADSKDIQNAAESFLGNLLVLRKLWNAYQQSKGKRLEGDDEVADLLGLSPTAVYCLMEMVKLDPKDFVEAKSFEELLWTNKALLESSSKILELAKIFEAKG